MIGTLGVPSDLYIDPTVCIQLKVEPFNV